MDKFNKETLDKGGLYQCENCQGLHKKGSAPCTLDWEGMVADRDEEIKTLRKALTGSTKGYKDTLKSLEGDQKNALQQIKDMATIMIYKDNELLRLRKQLAAFTEEAPMIVLKGLPEDLVGIAGLKSLPVVEGSLGGTYIYFLCAGGIVKYVGQSKGLMKRMSDHVKEKPAFDQIFYLPIPESELNSTEKHFIGVYSKNLWNIKDNPDNPGRRGFYGFGFPTKNITLDGKTIEEIIAEDD